jgi:hypothetical protein
LARRRHEAPAWGAALVAARRQHILIALPDWLPPDGRLILSN